MISPLMRNPAGLVFVSALLLRWAYAALSYGLMGLQGISGADSRGFIGDAAEFAGRAIRGELAGWDWLGLDLSLMPMLAWTLAGLTVLFGDGAPVVFVALQAIVDAGTCVLIFLIARSIVPDRALFAGLFAALVPTMIVVAGLVYTDSLFTFFATLMLFAVVHWIDDPAWRWVLLAGIAIGLAALTRAMILPWIAPLGLFVIAATLVLKRPLARTLGQLVVAGLVVAVLFAPVIARNVVRYDAWALSPQSGLHLAYWVVPLVQEAADGTPWSETVSRLQTRFKATDPGARSDNPFYESQRLVAFGNAELDRLGTASIAKAWIYGAVLNIGSPAGTLSPPIAALPRTGFYDTPGASKSEKIGNFLFASDNPLFAWVTVIGAAGVLVARLLQVAGFVHALFGDRRQLLVVGILTLWCLYVLVINGPVASPKYRLPLEPALAIFAAFGAASLRSMWLRLRRDRRPGAS